MVNTKKYFVFATLENDPLHLLVLAQKGFETVNYITEMAELRLSNLFLRPLGTFGHLSNCRSNLSQK